MILSKFSRPFSRLVNTICKNTEWLTTTYLKQIFIFWNLNNYIRFILEINCTHRLILSDTIILLRLFCSLRDSTSLFTCFRSSLSMIQVNAETLPSLYDIHLLETRHYYRLVGAGIAKLVCIRFTKLIFLRKKRLQWTIISCINIYVKMRICVLWSYFVCFNVHNYVMTLP